MTEKILSKRYVRIYVSYVRMRTSWKERTESRLHRATFDRRIRWIENRRIGRGASFLIERSVCTVPCTRQYRQTIESNLSNLPSIARITYSSIFGRSIKARLMQTRLYVLERRSERSTVAHAYLASGPCAPRCGSRSRFSRTEANPRFRIPYAVAYREGPQALSLHRPPFIPLETYLPTCLPTERSKAKSRDNSR